MNDEQIDKAWEDYAKTDRTGMVEEEGLLEVPKNNSKTPINANFYGNVTPTWLTRKRIFIGDRDFSAYEIMSLRRILAGIVSTIKEEHKKFIGSSEGEMVWDCFNRLFDASRTPDEIKAKEEWETSILESDK